MPVKQIHHTDIDDLVHIVSMLWMDCTYYCKRVAVSAIFRV